MAAERATAPAAQPLPLPPRFSASSSSPATVGALLTKAASAASGAPRECRSPRSLLSRILGRVGGGGAGGGFGCRLRLPRYCSSGAAAKEDAGQEEEVAGPKVVGGRAEVRESPRSSLQGKKEAAAAAVEVSPASLGLGASLVLLLSKGAAELSRMAELRAQMERLVLDVKADARGSKPSNASESASVVKAPIVFAGEEDADDPRTAASACASGGNAGRRADAAAAEMDQMEAELEAELTRLQLASSNDEDSAETPRRDHQLETEAKSDVSSESGSPTRIDIDNDNDSVIDDGRSAQGCEEDDDTEEDEEKEEMPPHGGVPARELERRLHELLQSRHEERIAELESELQRARRKLQEKEREVSRWRDTAKLVSRHKDDSRLR